MTDLTTAAAESVGITPFSHPGLDGSATLAFQPAVDLSTGRLLGFEALLRWHDLDGNNVAPSLLIPRAEATGHMNGLNQWVLSEACAQAARWPSDLQLAVNCSIFQLRHGTAAIAAASALEESGLNPDRLTVEVTEISVHDQHAAADMQAMSKLGIQLTVDDVGLDWSVLENLRDCVVNTVKIDAALVAGLTAPGGTRGIVETIAGRSRALGMCTVAEAVETGGQVRILREIRIDTAQGYFFSPPVTATEASRLATMNPAPSFALSGP